MKSPFYLICLLLLLASCHSAEEEHEEDQNLLDRLYKKIEQGDYPNSNAVLISQNDSLLYEWYFNGYGKDSLQDVRSTTKSVTALLAGIAIDQGLIKSVEDPIFSYLSMYNENNIDNWEERKLSISVEDLLTMRTGIGCEQFFGDMGFPDCEERMFGQEDWVKYGLSQKMAHTPGDKWLYTGTAPMIMGAVISEASDASIDKYADQYLFAQLDITDQYRWTKNRNTGRVFTAGNLWISPRNMLTLGQVVINRGKYNGVQVISKGMIEEILDEKVQLPFNYSFFETAGNTWQGQKPAKYGYYWYTERALINGREVTLKFTFGNGGNYIVLVPELDNLVMVFTGSNYGKPILNKQAFDMMYRYVLPHFLNS